HPERGRRPRIAADRQVGRASAGDGQRAAAGGDLRQRTEHTNRLRRGEGAGGVEDDLVVADEGVRVNDRLAQAARARVKRISDQESCRSGAVFEELGLEPEMMAV